MMKIENLVRVDEVLSDLPDEWILERVRIWRDAELKASDWTQIIDSTADKAAWAEYRQALRDLPTSKDNPKNIIFPVKPS
jgi:hypothetical protein